MSTNTYYSPFFPAPATAGAKGSTVAAVTTDAVGVIKTDVGNNTKAISDQKKVIDYLTTSGFTDGVAPSLPKDLSLTSVLTDAGVTLRAVWTANTEADVAGYVLAIKEGSGNYVEFTTSSNSFERNALARNTAYTAKVAAYDKAGNRSGFSSEVVYTTVKDNVYPGNVINPTLETTYNTAFVKWTNPNDADLSSVRVILKNASNNAVVRDVAVASSGGTNGSATFTNLTAATYYFATLYTSDTSRNDNVDRGLGVNTPVILTAGGLVVSDFTPGLSPIQTVTALPAASGYTGPSIVYYQGKLYRYTNGAWTSAVDGGDVVANTLPGTALVPTTNIPSTITVAGVTGSNTLSDAFKRADWTTVTGVGKPSDYASVGENIVQNPSLGIDASGWVLQGTANRITRSSSDPANYIRSTSENSQVYSSDKLPVSLGQKTLYYSYWRRITSSVGYQQTFDLSWFDGAGNYLSNARDSNFGSGYLNANQTTPVTAPFNTWFLVTGSFEIPLGAAFVSWASVFTNDANNPADFALPFISTTEPSVSRNNKVATSDFGAAAGDNLILNGEFLDGLNNYTKSGSRLVAIPGSSTVDPLAFARMSGGAGDAALISRSNQRVPVQAGRTVYFSGKFRSSKAGAQFVVSAYGVTATSAYGGDMSNNNVFITAANTWQDFEFKAIVPNTAATAVVQWTAADPGSGNYSDIASLRMAYTQKGATVGAPVGTYVGLTPAEVVEIRSNDPATRINQNTVTVDGGKITADTVDAIQLKAGSVTTNKMTVNSILGDRIAANTLSADKIISRSITATQIAANTVTATEIAANTITSNELSAGSITADKIATGAITIGGSASAGNLYDTAGNPVNINRLATNLVDLSKWVPGFNSSAVTNDARPYFDLGGGLCSIVLANGASGASEITLKASKNNSDSAAQGGFSVSIPQAAGFDPAKTYRYSFWVYKDYVTATSGFCYFGLVAGKNQLIAVNNNTITGIQTGNIDNNPYFGQYGYSTTPGKLYLVVGIVHGSSYSGGYSGVTGIYDPTTGQKVSETSGIAINNEYKWTTNATDGGFRSFQYYGESGKSVYFSRIKVEEVTSATPSVAQMMATVGAPAGTYVGTTLSTDVERYANDPAARVNANVTTISGGKITTGTITALQIAANTITSSQIAANTITSNQIAANTIGANNLVAATRPISGIGFNFRVDTDGVLRWDNGTLYMIDNAGNQQIISIPASGIAWTGNPIYIVKYNQGSNNNFDVLENRPDILNNGAYTPIAIWSSPKVFTTLIGVGTLINGDGIVTGSVNADRIKARTITADRLATNSITANEIATGTITAAQIAAGAIRADKLAVGNGGSALNDGSDMSDPSAWQLYQGSFGVFKPISNGQAGAYAMESAGYGVLTWINGARRISIDMNKTYRIHMWVRTVDGSGSSFYGGVAAFDASGSNISADGAQWLYSASNVTPPSSWTEYNFVFGAGTSRPFPVNARTISPLMILSYGGGNSLHQVQDVRIEEVLPSTLIQDGAITTNKITVGTLNGDRISTGSLDAATIKAGTVLSSSVTVNNTQLSTIANQAANSASITLDVFGAQYSVAGSRATKIQPARWYSNVYSKESFTGGASLQSQFIFGQGEKFFGLQDNRNVGNSNDYGLINYAWYYNGAGSWSIFEIGTPVQTFTNYTEQTNFRITYDGLYIRYYADFNLVRQVPTSNNRTFWASIAISDIGASQAIKSFTAFTDNSLSNADPAARINSGPTTQIDPGKILISGGTSLSNWRQGGDETRIAGGSISANTISANKLNIGNRNVSTIGLNFEWNPNNNYVYWSNGYFYYQDDNGNSVQTYISEGNSGGAGAHQFFYWIKGEGIIRMTQDVGTPTGNDRIMIGAWWGGTNLNINIGGTIIHGDRITTGTITANRLNVASLSSITANVGELTAGTIRNQDSSTIMDLNNGVFQFNINTFRLNAPGYTTQYPFEFANGSLKMKNVAIEGGSLTDVSINTNKLVNNSVTRNAYMVVPSGGTLSSYPQNQWTTFDTGNGGSSSGGYAGSGGGGGTAGGGGSGGGTTRNVQLQ